MRNDILSNHHIVLWGIFLVGLILRGYGLSGQPPLDDEAAAASAAYNYLEHGLFGQVMWYHPPLRNFVIFVSGKLIGGYSAWGLRAGSLILGSLTVPLLGYFAHSLFKNRLISFLAAFFICVDPIHISASREAFQETTTMFFVVAGVLAAFHAIKKDNILLCYVSGILFGLAISSKWHGLFSLAASASAYVAAPWLVRDFQGDRRVHYRLLAASAAFAVVPAVIYTAVYLPWLDRGYSFFEFVNLQLWLVKNQYYHTGVPYSELYVSVRAYEWFLMPTSWTDFVFHEGKPYLNIAMGNFLVWGLTLPALYFSVRAWIKNRDFGLGCILVLFSVQYIPLLLTTRSIWVFLPPVIQFAFIITAFAVTGFVESGRISRRTLIVYLCLVAILSAVMYPMSIFRALEYSYLKPLADLYSPH